MNTNSEARQVSRAGAIQLRPALVLVSVALAELVLFADYHAERWRKALQPRQQIQTSRGEGLVIRSDGLGYYAWLRSAVIDGDWSFDNEFDEHNPLGDYVPPRVNRTEIGRRRNQWSVGPACVWAGIVVPCHFAWKTVVGDDSTYPADGYSLPYQLMVGFTTLVASWLGLWFLYRIARHFADPERAAWAAGLMTLATTIVYYDAVEPSMAHGLGTVAAAGLVWCWLASYGSIRPGRWLLVGGLLGVAMLMRWQAATLVALPAGEAAMQWWHRRSCLWDTIGRLILSAAGTSIAFFPQMLAWHQVYGPWLTSPLTPANHWTTPSIGALLWSHDRGLFYWTPITGIALIGIVLSLVQRPKLPSNTRTPNREPLLLLLMAFGLQIYVLGSLWGNEVSLAVAFGCRQLTESVVLLVPGLALLLSKTSGRLLKTLGAAGCLLALWNLLLISAYRYGWLPADAGAEPVVLLQAAAHLVLRKKFLLWSQVALGPALLAMCLAGMSWLEATRRAGEFVSRGRVGRWCALI